MTLPVLFFSGKINETHWYADWRKQLLAMLYITKRARVYLIYQYLSTLRLLSQLGSWHVSPVLMLLGNITTQLVCVVGPIYSKDTIIHHIICIILYR